MVAFAWLLIHMIAGILFRANHFSLLQRSLSLIPHWDERPLGRTSLRLLKVTAIGSPGRHSTVTLGFKNYYMLLCYGLCWYITLDITSLSFFTKSPIKFFFCQSELGEAGLKYSSKSYIRKASSLAWYLEMYFTMELTYPPYACLVSKL